VDFTVKYQGMPGEIDFIGFVHAPDSKLVASPQ
jgi:hypothetical protein